MEVLSYIDLPVHDGKAVARLVQEFITKNAALVNSPDVAVRISIQRESDGSTRANKAMRFEQLRALMDANPDLPTVWKEGKYTFDFAALTFTKTVERKKVDLNITAGEIVMLWQRLIKGHKMPNWTAFYANMRKRLGEDFLEGFV
jgi:hypothetical protein